MTESNLLVFLLVLTGLVLAGVVTLMVVVLRRFPHTRNPKHDLRINRLTTALRRLKATIHPLARSTPSPDNVITRLSFGDSLTPEVFATASQEAALTQVNTLLRRGLADGVSLTANSVRLYQSGAEMVVSASHNGRQLLADGKVFYTRSLKTGRRLPQLRSTRGIKENLQEVSAATKTISRLGALSAAVVGAAHIVSGADIAKRLKLIDKKVDLLLAYRQIEQMARLERIYTSARELLSGSMSRDVRRKLFDLRGELRELRTIWRLELQHHLNAIDDPGAASWLKRTFTLQKSTDRNVHGQITEGQLRLALIEYSLRLDQAIAMTCDMATEYEGTLASELVQLKEVASLLEMKAGYISGKYADLLVEPTVKGMFAIIEQYQQLLPDATQSAHDQRLLSTAAPVDEDGGCADA